MVILITEILDLKAKRFTRVKENNFIKLKDLIHHERITILNFYAYNNTFSIYIK